MLNQIDPDAEGAFRVNQAGDLVSGTVGEDHGVDDQVKVCQAEQYTTKLNHFGTSGSWEKMVTRGAPMAKDMQDLCKAMEQSKKAGPLELGRALKVALASGKKDVTIPPPKGKAWHEYLNVFVEHLDWEDISACHSVQPSPSVSDDGPGGRSVGGAGAARRDWDLESEQVFHRVTSKTSAEMKGDREESFHDDKFPHSSALRAGDQGLMDKYRKSNLKETAEQANLSHPECLERFDQVVDKLSNRSPVPGIPLNVSDLRARGTKSIRRNPKTGPAYTAFVITCLALQSAGKMNELSRVECTQTLQALFLAAEIDLNAVVGKSCPADASTKRLEGFLRNLRLEDQDYSAILDPSTLGFPDLPANSAGPEAPTKSAVKKEEPPAWVTEFKKEFKSELKSVKEGIVSVETKVGAQAKQFDQLNSTVGKHAKTLREQQKRSVSEPATTNRRVEYKPDGPAE